jgi:uncharacterized Zn finger protein (UPF0148 family)
LFDSGDRHRKFNLNIQPSFSSPINKGFLEWIEERDHKQARALERCGDTYVEMKCKEGHRFLKRVYCGRMFCPVCGEKGSDVHKRRVKRSLSRLEWGDVWYTIVFTVPEGIRERFKSKEKLTELSRRAWEVVEVALGSDFQDLGGMVTVHLFGDRSEFHPHVNVTIPARLRGKVGFPKGVVRRLKELWAKTLGVVEVVVDVKYKTSKRQKMHWLRYVLRSTCNWERFKRLSQDLREFILFLARWHNVRWYGILANCKYRKWLEDHLVSLLLEEGCPICGRKLFFVAVWEGRSVRKYWIELGCGFYYHFNLSGYFDSS